jgi:hypothetical protein
MLQTIFTRSNTSLTISAANTDDAFLKEGSRSMKQLLHRCRKSRLVTLGFSLLVVLLTNSRECCAFVGSEQPANWRREEIQNKPNPSLASQGVVGEIVVLGNEVTPDSIILNQLKLYSGVHFSQKDLENAQRRLARLGLFECSHVAVKVDRERTEFKTILVGIKERPDTYLRLKLVTCLRLLQGWQVGGLPVALVSEGGGFIGQFFVLLKDLRREFSTPP